MWVQRKHIYNKYAKIIYMNVHNTSGIWHLIDNDAYIIFINSFVIIIFAQSMSNIQG